jgi:acetyl-CoA acetyltransferase
MEVFAKESHDRALRAIAEGRFDREVVPYGDFRMDETARASTLEKMATLAAGRPHLSEDHRRRVELDLRRLLGGAGGVRSWRSSATA